MPVLTFTPPVRPFAGTSDKPELKILKADFGDGYTSRTADGINNVRKVLSLKWDNILDVEADAIVDFLTARKGVEPFLFQLRPTRPAIRFTCEEWSDEYGAAGRRSLTATLRQDFGLSS